MEWRTDWDNVPEDTWVLLATSGGWHGEALMLTDEETGEQKWEWATGGGIGVFKPLAWMPMPAHPFPLLENEP